MEIDLVLAATLLLSATLAATAGVLALAALQARMTRAKGAIFVDMQAGTTFLFDGDMLVDATPGARALLSLGGLSGSPWVRLLSYLAPRFPDFETQLLRLQQEGRLTLASSGEGASLLLRAEARGGLTRISLLDPDEQAASAGPDLLTQRAVQEELTSLRGTVAQAPILIWREGREGEVIWANAVYLSLAIDRLEAGQDLAWPLPRLFDRIHSAQDKTHQRLAVPGKPDRWFNLTVKPDGEGWLVFALPADAVVQAETALRDFTQTLTKTFAHLPIGLAIFDRQRQLVLFNPALLDLSSLPPDFLSARPTLFAFLDAMRDRNMIPEPKDYRSWRKQMSELERAAASGLFEETWALPSGQTYKVIGRPHPNGALALMFEDISTEISRIRRYRADLELSQAVIDAVDQALAVFSPAGLLVMTNAAYSELWGHAPAETIAGDTLRSICDHWRSRSGTTQIWAEAERFGSQPEDRTPVDGEVRLLDGRLLECSFAPLPGGATLARFKLLAQAEGQTAALALSFGRKLA
ncbi:PAS fold [Gemmobacter aquatilis]|uniref:PAS fold n=1 Tax=Gemmobacter aquatilis TaxID=933059 RepID=A0A1H7YZP9_9RHOB|nr:PAS-domain containing protein [Gemmobacter aquatilis]SEM50709.1 PAS fold [Gemmobacter aquatilis]